MSEDALQVKAAEKAKKARTARTEILPEVALYYDTLESLLKAVGAYVRASKFQANINNPETNWKPKLQETFQKYYGGSYDKLAASVRLKREECYGLIEGASGLCREAGVSPVRKPRVLFELLLGEKRRKYWRKAIKMHKKQNEIVSLQQIEREYRSPF